MEVTKQFSIDDIEEFKDDGDVDFAIAKIRFLSDGNNAYNNPISTEVLKECADSAIGKFIVAKFNKWTKDATTHVLDEAIVGYVDPRSKIEFEVDEKDPTKIWAVCEARISKLYATEIYKLFKDNNFRHVSVEFSTITEREEDDPRKRQSIPNPILKFEVRAITILGLDYTPAVKGASIKIKQFAEEINNPLKQFAKDRKEKLENKGSDEMEEEKKEFVEEDKDKEVDKEMETPTDDKQEEKELSDDEKVDEEKESEDKNEDEENKEDKEFSLDANLDASACLALLEKETDDYKELATELWECKKYSIVMSKCLSIAKERDEALQKMAKLEAFKEEKDKETKAFSVQKVLSAVGEDLTKEKYEEFKTQGMECTLDQLTGWENTVKAFAYEVSKSKPKTDKKTDILKFGFDNPQDDTKKALTPEEVFKKYLG